MAHHVNDVTLSTENYTTPGDVTRPPCAGRALFLPHGAAEQEPHGCCGARQTVGLVSGWDPTASTCTPAIRGPYTAGPQAHPRVGTRA
ncbi:hypothetical protein GCM10022240_31780 [Microbacterium kribbense]|uniref:Uncharacterized protein n=1 Tax=Microbacterium kribbense TaxID=433645 RepID=A0ABP7H2X2_9MICO